MALGVPGTGPYGRIRFLRKEIEQCRYEIRLIVEQSMLRPFEKSQLEEIITKNRAEIRKILADQKSKKQAS